MTNIGIIGAGRWGTTLAILLNQNGNTVRLFCREEELDFITSKSYSPYLEDYLIPTSVRCSSSPKMLEDCEVVFVAIPGQYLAMSWPFWANNILSSTVVANTAKMVANKANSLIFAHQIIEHQRFAQFVSAAFPGGILEGMPTIGGAYSEDIEARQIIQRLFYGTPIRVYTSEDVIGAEIGSAMKNVIAIATGIASEYFHPMTCASLVSRGAREISKFGERLGAKSTTFGHGSVFLADLILTCFCDDSRNYTAGKKIAQGVRVSDLEKEKEAIEGLHTARTLSNLQLISEKDLPITYMVCEVIAGNLTVNQAREILLARPSKTEDE